MEVEEEEVEEKEEFDPTQLRWLGCGLLGHEINSILLSREPKKSVGGI